MAVGFPVKADYATGDVLSAANMNDLSGSVNLLTSAQYAAGKNKIINGDFGVWQRGTSFTNNTSFLYAYTVDRFLVANNNGGTVITSQQTFTPGTAPVAGYEGKYFCRVNATVSGTGNRYFIQRLEDVQTFAGQTVTISFWAKANSTLTTAAASFYFDQNFGSGGSVGVGTNIPTGNFSVTTSWQRYTFTVAVPSIAGKTIGAGNYLGITWTLPDALSTFTLDTWGWQLEAGSTATAFQTATGTIQGELAACQRYFVQFGGDAAYQRLANGSYTNTTNLGCMLFLPVTMRVAPSTVTYGTLTTYDGATFYAISSLTIDAASKNTVQFNVVTATATQYRFAQLLTNNSTSGYLGLSAEL
jgi:hypothetical protein